MIVRRTFSQVAVEALAGNWLFMGFQLRWHPHRWHHSLRVMFMKMEASAQVGTVSCLVFSRSIGMPFTIGFRTIGTLKWGALLASNIWVAIAHWFEVCIVLSWGWSRACGADLSMVAHFPCSCQGMGHSSYASFG